MTELMNLGVGGAVIVLVIKEMFLFLRGDKKNDGLIAIARTLDNSTMMLQFIRESMKNHETNAKDRNDGMIKIISDHGANCSKQADRLERMISK